MDQNEVKAANNNESMSDGHDCKVDAANIPSDAVLWPPPSKIIHNKKNNAAAAATAAADHADDQGHNTARKNAGMVQKPENSQHNSKLTGTVDKHMPVQHASSDHDNEESGQSSLPPDTANDDGRPVCAGVDIGSLQGRLKGHHLPVTWPMIPYGGPMSSRPIDSGHVAMPYTDTSRWRDITKALGNIKERMRRDITNIGVFADIIYEYNSWQNKKWDFTGFYNFTRGEVEMHDSAHGAQLLETLDRMGKLAIQLDRICPEPIPLLKKGKSSQALTLNQRQVACLLANAFFCTFPMRNKKPSYGGGKSGGSGAPKSSSEGGLPLPSINFNSLFKSDLASNVAQAQKEKLKCVMNYFQRVTSNNCTNPGTLLTFERRHLDKNIDWKNSVEKFHDLHVTATGNIEVDGKGMLQVDFANKMVGGGVLGRGLVQEEIRFLGYTELIVSRLFTEVLGDLDCLIVTGCEQFNKHHGYSYNFQWKGDYKDQTECTENRRLVQVVVIDAKRFFQGSEHVQFDDYVVERELNKAYCGFHSPDVSSAVKPLPAIATGNWGCGDFRGDRHLKALIQLMAAAQSQRDICYFTFGDRSFVEDLKRIHSFIRDFDFTVGDVYRFIQQFCNICRHSDFPTNLGLFNYIFKTYRCYDGSSDSSK